MTGLRCSMRRAFQSTVFTADHDCNAGPGSLRRYLQSMAMGIFPGVHRDGKRTRRKVSGQTKAVIDKLHDLRRIGVRD